MEQTTAITSNYFDVKIDEKNINWRGKKSWLITLTGRTFFVPASMIKVSKHNEDKLDTMTNNVIENIITEIIITLNSTWIYKSKDGAWEGREIKKELLLNNVI